MGTTIRKIMEIIATEVGMGTLEELEEEELIERRIEEWKRLRWSIRKL